MPYLYCTTHGQEREAEIIAHQADYRETGETVLIVSGRLISGPWLCDRCNLELAAGTATYLISALPGWVAEGLTDYAFDYERGYFAMRKADKAVAYGADWPDDSIRNRRPISRHVRRQAKSPPLCALDLLKPD